MAEIFQNGRNTLGKGETVCYEQFILFPQFSKDLLQTCKIQGKKRLKTWLEKKKIKRRKENH